MSDPDVTQIAQTFLEAHSTLALATVNADGTPEVAPVFYISDERLNLYWLSTTSSRHSVNLAAQPRVAATVYPTVWQWNEIVGLQIEGEASIIGDERIREHILTRYLRKFQLPPSFDAAIAATTLYVLRPSWLRWVDNSVKFGHKVEITL
jgi:hypothetical protein